MAAMDFLLALLQVAVVAADILYIIIATSRPSDGMLGVISLSWVHLTAYVLAPAVAAFVVLHFFATRNMAEHAKKLLLYSCAAAFTMFVVAMTFTAGKSLWIYTLISYVMLGLHCLSAILFSIVCRSSASA